MEICLTNFRWTAINFVSLSVVVVQSSNVHWIVTQMVWETQTHKCDEACAILTEAFPRWAHIIQCIEWAESLNLSRIAVWCYRCIGSTRVLHGIQHSAAHTRTGARSAAILRIFYSRWYIRACHRTSWNFRIVGIKDTLTPTTDTATHLDFELLKNVFDFPSLLCVCRVHRMQSSIHKHSFGVPLSRNYFDEQICCHLQSNFDGSIVGSFYSFDLEARMLSTNIITITMSRFNGIKPMCPMPVSPVLLSLEERSNKAFSKFRLNRRRNVSSLNGNSNDIYRFDVSHLSFRSGDRLYYSFYLKYMKFHLKRFNENEFTAKTVSLNEFTGPNGMVWVLIQWSDQINWHPIEWKLIALMSNESCASNEFHSISSSATTTTWI